MEAATGGVWERFHPRAILFNYGIPLLTASFTAGCAAGPNLLKDSLDLDGSSAGFWLGLWHGMILPITFVVSLFTDGVSIYEVHNNGGWYNFGFLVGAFLIIGGVGASASRRREIDSERDQDVSSLEDVEDEDEDDEYV